MPYPSQQLPGGYAAGHPVANPFPILAAPATRIEKNTIRIPLVSTACWRLNDLRFDFDSSFVVPAAHAEFVALRKIIDAHPGSPMSVFGHADPVGNQDYNKALSGRRAEAIYALLTHDIARWEKLYKAEWGLAQTQTILDALAYDPGPVSGGKSKKSTEAIQSFQRANNLVADGEAGPKTRAVLFQKYFEFLFPRKVEKMEFLHQGADPGGKGDFQGCGEFNPAMILSEPEAKKMTEAERNSENGVNRRVLILFFLPGTKPDLEEWPCPRVAEGAGDCRKRFWSNAQKRQTKQSERRTFADTEDTFACRFYHRLTEASPCEISAARLMFVEVFIDYMEDYDGYEDSYRLVSEDGEYDRTLFRSQAAALNAVRDVLTFTNVIAGQKYALYHFPSPGIRVEIFSGAALPSVYQPSGMSHLVFLSPSLLPEPDPPVRTSSDPLIDAWPGGKEPERKEWQPRKPRHSEEYA
ncbi:MAG: hypothetical protein FJW30_12250 [Acidobacteria bacterium]|nr:hypothetical protein [Acidobacteriota bacterium]